MPAIAPFVQVFLEFSAPIRLNQCRQLQGELQAMEALLETNGWPMKQSTLDKVRKQLAGVSALVDLWWQTVRQDLERKRSQGKLFENQQLIFDVLP